MEKKLHMDNLVSAQCHNQDFFPPLATVTIVPRSQRYTGTISPPLFSSVPLGLLLFPQVSSGLVKNLNSPYFTLWNKF